MRSLLNQEKKAYYMENFLQAKKISKEITTEPNSEIECFLEQILSTLSVTIDQPLSPHHVYYNVIMEYYDLSIENVQKNTSLNY